MHHASVRIRGLGDNFCWCLMFGGQAREGDGKMQAPSRTNALWETWDTIDHTNLHCRYLYLTKGHFKFTTTFIAAAPMVLSESTKIPNLC